MQQKSTNEQNHYSCEKECINNLTSDTTLSDSDKSSNSVDENESEHSKDNDDIDNSHISHDKLIIDFEKEYAMQWQLLKEFLIDNKAKYKELYNSYKYIISLPVTQVKCETDFSLLKRVKNYSRTLMSNKMLESIMIISLGRELIPDSTHPEIINLIGNSSNKLRTQLIHNFNKM